MAAAEIWMLLLAGPLVGVTFGATGTVSRVLLIALSPPEKVGEFFGFYGMAGRFSAIAGPALTGLILAVFGGLGDWSYRLAVLSLALLVGLSLALVARVPDKSPERAVGVSQGGGNRRTPTFSG